MQDMLWLRQYVEKGSQTAFSNLVERYTNLVYSTCLRELHDEALAEDVTQAVFLLLAHKAPTLKPETVLSGWLFQTARFVAKRARKREERRQHYEQQAAAELVRALDQPQGDVSWQQLEPLLDDALETLSKRDREAILLRFFEDKSLREVGEAMGIAEDAARMRVTRAVEKLKRYFTRLGFPVSGAILVMRISTHAVQAAPATCRVALARLTTTLPHISPIPTTVTGSPTGASSTTTAALPGSPIHTANAKALVLYEQATRALSWHHLKITGGIVAASLLLSAGAGLITHLNTASTPQLSSGLRQNLKPPVIEQAVMTRQDASPGLEQLPMPGARSQSLHNAEVVEVATAPSHSTSRHLSIPHSTTQDHLSRIAALPQNLHKREVRRPRSTLSQVSLIANPAPNDTREQRASRLSASQRLAKSSTTNTAANDKADATNEQADVPGHLNQAPPAVQVASSLSRHPTQAKVNPKVDTANPAKPVHKITNSSIPTHLAPVGHITPHDVYPAVSQNSQHNPDDEDNQNDSSEDAKDPHSDNGVRDHGRGIGRGRGQGKGRGWLMGRGHWKNKGGDEAPDSEAPEKD